MTKSQSKQAFNTASGQQAKSSGNAQSSYEAAEADIGNFGGALAKYGAENPYVQGDQFQTASNQQIADTGAAGSQATSEAIQSAMVRSGINPAAAIAAGKQIAMENNRTQTADQARLNQQRLSDLTQYNTSVLNETAKPEEMQAGLMKDQLQAEQGALGQETEASKTPSFWQELGQGVINAGTGFATGMCPAEGSLYLMADSTEIPVELLRVGDFLRGIDGEPQEIEEIQRALSKVLKIETAGGHILRCSRVHAFALPAGGFVCATKALGKVVLTGGGSGRVVKIEDDGVAMVYNVITDGTHTYRANGLWSLGVGDAERAVTMDEWNRIAEGVR